MKRDSSLLLHSTRAAFRAVALTLVLSAPLSAQEGESLPPDSLSHPPPPRTEAFFYRGLTYGSEAYIGPLDVILNKGLALTRAKNGRRDIFDIDYGWEGVWDTFTNPGKAIERSGGWGDFLKEEVLPFNLNVRGNGNQAKWWANYFGHLMEGGITYRRMAEWNQAKGVPFPYLMSGVLSFGAAVLNEAYENQGGTRGTSGSVADLYIFDLAGIFLFSRDDVSRFFADKLRATVWPLQASLTLPDLLLMNNGNHLVMKIPVSPIPRTSVFFQSGINAHFGLTLHLSNGLDLSAGAGPAAKERFVDPDTGDESVTFQFSGVFAVDRENSLLASLIWTEMPNRWLSLNVYPGVIKSALGDLGAWVVLTRDGGLQFGITHHRLMGLGLGFAK